MSDDDARATIRDAKRWLERLRADGCAVEGPDADVIDHAAAQLGGPAAAPQ
jgi:hypothetical protein